MVDKMTITPFKQQLEELKQSWDDREVMARVRAAMTQPSKFTQDYKCKFLNPDKARIHYIGALSLSGLAVKQVISSEWTKRTDKLLEAIRG